MSYKNPQVNSKVLYKLTTPVASSSTDITTFFNYTLPANTMGINSSLRISWAISCNNNGNAKTVVMKFGSTDIISQNIPSVRGWVAQRTIVNRSSQSSQAVFGNSTSSYATTTISTPIITMTENTASDVLITMNGLKANGSDTLQFEYVVIELLD